MGASPLGGTALTLTTLLQSFGESATSLAAEEASASQWSTLSQRRRTVSAFTVAEETSSVSSGGRSPNGERVPKTRQVKLAWTKKNFDPDAKHSILIEVRKLTPKEAEPGGPIIPIDEDRRLMRKTTGSVGPEIEEGEKVEAKMLLKRLQAGEPWPEDGARLETPGETAHQLMESGDFGNGPPFPLDYEPPPAWRRGGREVMDTTVRTRQELGKGSQAEFVRCFANGIEKKCEQKADEPEEDSFGGPACVAIAGTLAAARVGNVCLWEQCGGVLARRSTRPPRALWSFL